MAMKPPVALRRPHHFTLHDITVDDPYHWLKDPGYPDVTDPDVLDYLSAENAYFEDYLGPHASLVDELFQEIKGRQPEEDESVPYRKGGYWYRWVYLAGAQYRTWLRSTTTDPEGWTVMLDETTLAEQHDYFNLGGLAVSPDGKYLAWSADCNGSERYTLKVRDLATGEDLAETIEQTINSPVWSQDSQHLFYPVVNEQWRPYRVCRHRIGSTPKDDVIVYEETDESFFVGVDETQSEAFILISTGDHVTSEVRYLSAHTPTDEPQLIAARRTGHEYYVDHREGRFFIRSNRRHKNFDIVSVADESPAEANWQTAIAGDRERYLVGHLCFKDYLIVGLKIDGLDQILIRDLTSGKADAEHHIEFPETAYDIHFGANAEYATDTLRLAYSSMVTPTTVYDYQITDKALEERKVQKIPSGYDAANYTAVRLQARARDGVTIPVSLVYRKGREQHGLLYLYAYGAYGHAVAPSFSPNRLSLLDRGFAFAIAHVRGGDDLGYHWYEDGKLDKRTNTFNDFVDVARFLIDEAWTNAGRIAIGGGSAGGELIGAVVNQAPELWGTVVAHVPFVDVLNTMVDASLPLTPMEWPEWGNPIEDKDAFEFIQSYSPYDQLEPGAYPPMLVTAGLNDPRVTYWEPAKYVAKLRTLKTDDNPLLLKTNMGAGHAGQSGRFDALKEVAEEYAFCLLNLKDDG